MQPIINHLTKNKIEFTLLPNKSIQIKRRYLNYDFNQFVLSLKLNIFYLDTTAVIY